MKTSYIYLLLIVLLSFPIFNSYAQNGKIKGRIVDISSNEPIPFVNIIIIINETQQGTTSDDNGNFAFSNLPPGFVKLTASFIGYKTIVSNEVLVSNANVAYVNIKMEKTDEQIEEVLVKASPFIRTQESPVSLRSIGLSEIERAPGANRDISKVIQSFPGVGSSVSFRNDIIIRGGGPSESRFYLDDVEVPVINHFATQGASGGPVGIINSDFIREVNYFSGAFPANRGNALSGVFEFKQIDGNKDKLKFRGAIGASEVSATLDGPIGEKTSFVFSARQSYLQFLFDVLGLPFLPTFNDFQFKSRTRINTKNEIIFIGLGALDKFKLNTGIENPTREQEYILSSLPVYNQWNYTVGGVYKHYFKKSYYTFVLSRSHLNNESYKYKDNEESSEANKTLDYVSQEIENKTRFEVTTRNKGYKINYGAGLDFVNYTNTTKQKLFLGNQLVEIDYDSDLKTIKYSVFGQVSHSYFNERLSLSFGVRSDANNYSSSMGNLLKQISPRLSASFLINKKLSLNFNTGKYYQLPAYTTLGYRENNEFVNKENELKYISSTHLIGGFEFTPTDYSQITIEGFYKKYNDYPYSLKDSMSIANKGADFGAVGDEAVKSDSEGRAYGFEVLGRIKTNKGFNFNLSYTFVRSEFMDYKKDYIPSSWDSKHLLTLTSTKSLKKNWNIGIKWRFVGSLPYTPYDLEKSSLIVAWDAKGAPYFNKTKLNSERYKAFHQLDVRVDKAWYFNRWSLMLYLDIQNFYNFKSEQQDYVVRAKEENGFFKTTDGGSNYVLERLANTSGTVLPTIGFMVEF